MNMFYIQPQVDIPPHTVQTIRPYIIAAKQSANTVIILYTSLCLSLSLSVCVYSVQGGPKSKPPTDLAINRFTCTKSSAILHVHQLGNDSILYQVACPIFFAITF